MPGLVALVCGVCTVFFPFGGGLAVYTWGDRCGVFVRWPFLGVIFSQGLLGVTWLRYIIGTKILIPMLISVSYVCAYFLLSELGGFCGYMYVTLRIGGSLLHRFTIVAKVR